MYCLDDTIAAISTPIGTGGIGIVRMSGPEAGSILARLFVPGKTGRRRVSFQSHRLYHGWISDPRSGDAADEVLASLMVGPRSYTRQDVAEISCHGGPAAMRQVLGLCLREGARPAQPGEFTLRAFVNGRLDLSQAEAVLEVIRARTDAGLRGSLGQLQGRLSREVREVRTRLLGTLAYLTATIDFAEQEVPQRDIGPELSEAAKAVDRLLGDADRGIMLRHGLRVVIAGRPNAGKSSLLNALLRASRAIVTPIPGTTRDTLEETLNLDGVPVVLVDTAGLHAEARDAVERLGIERTRDALAGADLTLLVVDGAAPLNDADRALAAELVERPVLVLHNKADLPDVARSESLLPEAPHVRVSALSGDGLEELEQAILNLVLGGRVTASDAPLVSSPRHKAALERATGHLEDARRGWALGLPADCITIDLAGCCDALGEITGETVGDDLLETIFRHFCIGK